MNQKEQMEVTTYQDILEYGEKVLAQEQILDAKLDSWYLLEEITGMSRSQFFLRKEHTISEKEKHHYFNLLEMRRKHIPLQHITQNQEFMGLPFFVNENVLIPRQDTECLVEIALPFVEEKTVLDMCTGSGCIAISLLKLGKAKECEAVDLSSKALEVAKKNATINQVKLSLIESDLFEKVEKKYDIIVSNPPYIPPKIIENLSEEVRDHEPRMALDGGEDGLEFYRKIACDAKNYLNKNGMIFFEIGCEQAQDVSDILEKQNYCEIRCQKDYAGKDRVIYAKWIEERENDI